MSDAASNLDNFTYIYLDKQAPKTLVLLHGTGGDEKDLLPLVENQKEKHNILGLRGNVKENGMNRFFKRSAMGVFDQESIELETKKLADFITAWATYRQQNTQDLVYIGYSNGANMILALLLRYPAVVHKAVALHPMLPFEPPKVDLHSKEILISYGEEDVVISAIHAQKAVAVLQKLGAIVHTTSHPGGHEIRSNELQALHEFLS
jgi:predicted esterase